MLVSSLSFHPPFYRIYAHTYVRIRIGYCAYAGGVLEVSIVSSVYRVLCSVCYGLSNG